MFIDAIQVVLGVFVAIVVILIATAVVMHYLER